MDSDGLEHMKKSLCIYVYYADSIFSNTISSMGVPEGTCYSLRSMTLWLLNHHMHYLRHSSISLAQLLIKMAANSTMGKKSYEIQKIFVCSPVCILHSPVCTLLIQSDERGQPAVVYSLTHSLSLQRTWSQYQEGAQVEPWQAAVCGACAGERWCCSLPVWLCV